MRTTVHFSVDIDSERWSEDHDTTGLKASGVRRQVQLWIMEGVVEELRELGLLRSDEVEDHSSDRIPEYATAAPDWEDDPAASP